MERLTKVIPSVTGVISSSDIRTRTESGCTSESNDLEIPARMTESFESSRRLIKAALPWQFGRWKKTGAIALAMTFA
jgi:hypothetical protein